MAAFHHNDVNFKICRESLKMELFMNIQQTKTYVKISVINH